MPDQGERLRKIIQELADSQPDDQRLRDHLEGISREREFAGLTWFWGPLLYRRSKAVFRPLILQHFSEWNVAGTRWQRVSWSSHADVLEGWLDACRKGRDLVLVRRLLRWKYAGTGWGLDHRQYRAAMLAAYRAAASAAARAAVLEEFDDWFELDEDSALAMYEIDRGCGSFLVKHLTQSFWGGDKRKLWTRLYRAAERHGDEKLQFALYRKQQPLKEWTAEVLALADRTASADKLHNELLLRHPEGYSLDTGSTLVELLKRRGTDVFPYVKAKLKDSFDGWGRSPKPLVDLAEQRGWWDLWAAAIRADGQGKLFDAAVGKLAADNALPASERRSRLMSLAGVSREWNFPGLGLAHVHRLDDKVATLLYGRYPDLVRGPFRAHVAPTWWRGSPQLLAAALRAQDADLVDLLASRYVTHATSPYGYRASKKPDENTKAAQELAVYYQAIRDRDAVEFAHRAANVLTRIPPYAIHAFDALLESNQLTRLLFVRSLESFLSVPEAVRDLVEGSDIHVQQLAYRVLALDDPRARELAAKSLDILLGTLLRPLHRKTRLAAFAALANAARHDEPSARQVLARARLALCLPDKRYPKEQLVGLLGQVLHVQPALRGPREQPVVYGLAEASA